VVLIDALAQLLLHLPPLIPRLPLLQDLQQLGLVGLVDQAPALDGSS
jgi:hypothetical protein